MSPDEGDEFGVGPDPAQDAVASLRDTESETGDEGELDDLLAVDRAEALELGIDLDPTGGDEPRLD